MIGGQIFRDMIGGQRDMIGGQIFILDKRILFAL